VCLCWNFGGTGASSHTEYKIITLTIEAVSVFQMSQFGACLYSLFKAKFNGKKAGCLQVESLKWFFSNILLSLATVCMTQPTPHQ